MKPVVVHDDQISQDGALLAPESNIETDGSQQQAPGEASEVTGDETGPRGGFATGGAAAHPGGFPHSAILKTLEKDSFLSACALTVTLFFN
ncbi:unnamed protein product [Caretta caretta]